MVYEIMINSLILILNKEENPMTRGRGVDFGQNFDDVIFEQPLKGTGAGFSASYLSPNVLKTTRLRH